MRSGYNSDLLAGARDAGVEPATPILAEDEAFVEQIDAVPLRALRLMHGEAVAKGELVDASALGPAQLILGTGKERAMSDHVRLGLLAGGGRDLFLRVEGHR